MKTLRLLVPLLLSAATLYAADPAYVVTELGNHHRVLARVVERPLPGGGVLSERQTYTELASGLGYFDRLQGRWLESQDLIEPVRDGAAALHGPYQAHFQSNLRTRGAVTLTLPDGGRPAQSRYRTGLYRPGHRPSGALR